MARLEASRVGRGSTAASTALLMQEPDEDFAALARRYGMKRARRIWELSRIATREFIRVTRHLDMRLPYIGPHRRYPRHLFALGYGGNGMTFGFLASRLLLDWYRGNQTRDHDLFAFGRL